MNPPTNSGPSATSRRSRRHYTWTVAAALLIVCGVAASVLAAGAVGRNRATSSHEAFQSDSAEVASTLQLAIQHEEDVVIDAGGVLADGRLSQTEFLQWANGARVLERYPELGSIAVLQLVKNADLAEFTAQVTADPPAGLVAGGTFEVQPPGTRDFYCLTPAFVSRDSTQAPVLGYDPCSDPASRAQLLDSRDSGLGNYQPMKTLPALSEQGSDAQETAAASLDDGQLIIQTPIYLGGSTPSTVAEHRAAIAGWVATPVDPAVLLERALQDKPGRAVELRYQEGESDVAFTSGTAPDDAEKVTIDLQNGWTVTTSGAVDAGGISHGNALLLLVGGIAVSVLLGLLMFVLGTGRERARRQLEQRTGQLNHQALHDALTGLPNRALVMDRVEQMLVRDRRHHTSGALMFLDLDDFKNVNDTLGHGAGDRLLVAVTERLSSTLRGVDTIGRMGGDEFVVLIDGDSLDVAPELVAQRLLDVMRQPFELDEVSMSLTVNVSIGIATGDRASAGELLRDADIALYQAKAVGKNCYEIFDPEMQSDISRRTDLEFDLRSALGGGQYRLVYQPIYELDGLTVVGVEALLRWDHPTRGLISPEEFIPILEQTGQIREVGRWVLHEACQQMATWHSRGDTLDISVNVSARQLDTDGIIDDIRQALHDSGLPAPALIIEVTETALMRNLDVTARRLREVRNLGVRIAVDDFGTGYSSLAYLQQFPVDCIKIDRAFTSAVTTSPESRALVATLVQLGKDLGLATLAEGVETAEEMDIMRGADVNQAQGFLMARPLDPGTLETTLLEPTRPTTPTSRS